MVFRNTLEDLLETLFVKHIVKTWSIFEDHNCGDTVVKIRFSADDGGHSTGEAGAGIVYKRKSQKQVRRDWERSTRHTTRTSTSDTHGNRNLRKLPDCVISPNGKEPIPPTNMYISPVASTNDAPPTTLMTQGNRIVRKFPDCAIIRDATEPIPPTNVYLSSEATVNYMPPPKSINIDKTSLRSNKDEFIETKRGVNNSIENFTEPLNVDTPEQIHNVPPDSHSPNLTTPSIDLEQSSTLETLHTCNNCSICGRTEPEEDAECWNCQFKISMSLMNNALKKINI